VLDQGVGDRSDGDLSTRQVQWNAAMSSGGNRTWWVGRGRVGSRPWPAVMPSGASGSGGSVGPIRWRRQQRLSRASPRSAWTLLHDDAIGSP